MADYFSPTGNQFIFPHKDQPSHRGNLDALERWLNSHVVTRVTGGGTTSQPVQGTSGTGAITVPAQTTGATENAIGVDITLSGGAYGWNSLQETNFVAFQTGPGTSVQWNVNNTGTAPAQANTSFDPGIQILTQGLTAVDSNTINFSLELVVYVIGGTDYCIMEAFGTLVLGGGFQTLTWTTTTNVGTTFTPNPGFTQHPVSGSSSVLQIALSWALNASYSITPP